MSCVGPIATIVASRDHPRRDVPGRTDLKNCKKNLIIQFNLPQQYQHRAAGEQHTTEYTHEYGAKEYNVLHGEC